MEPTRDREEPAAMVTDPVCGMSFPPDEAAAAVDHDGRRIHFCSPGCREEFEAEPGRYVGEDEGHHRHHAHPAEPAAAGAPPAGRRVYTCPMHPEVRQDGPGSCPKCGMALEPAGPAVPEAGVGEDELLRLAAGLERGSEHPLAAAIVAGAEARGVDIPAAERLDLEVDLRLGDVQALEFAEGSFEEAVASFVFCSVPDPVRGLRELGRIVAPGGGGGSTSSSTSAPTGRSSGG